MNSVSGFKKRFAAEELLTPDQELAKQAAAPVAGKALLKSPSRTLKKSGSMNAEGTLVRSRPGFLMLKYMSIM